MFFFLLFYLFFSPMDLPAVQLLYPEQDNHFLEDHSRDFLDLDLVKAKLLFTSTRAVSSQFDALGEIPIAPPPPPQILYIYIYIYIYIFFFIYIYIYIYIYILFRHQFLVTFKLVVIVTTLICGD